jgi:hypothetical protein
MICAGKGSEGGVTGEIELLCGTNVDGCALLRPGPSNGADADCTGGVICGAAEFAAG